jgi:hypothetical protein
MLDQSSGLSLLAVQLRIEVLRIDCVIIVFDAMFNLKQNHVIQTKRSELKSSYQATVL